jgi:Flp pilus assembly CpaE family ATPase
LVTDLSVPSVRAAQRTFELFVRLGLPSTRVDLLVTNTVPGPVALKDAVRAIGKEPLLMIPRDDTARESMNAGAPLNGGKPSPLVLTIADLARKVTGSPATQKAKRNRLLGFFTREGRR